MTLEITCDLVTFNIINSDNDGLNILLLKNIVGIFYRTYYEFIYELFYYLTIIRYSNIQRFEINASEMCVCKYDIEKMFEYFFKTKFYL